MFVSICLISSCSVRLEGCIHEGMAVSVSEKKTYIQYIMYVCMYA